MHIAAVANDETLSPEIRLDAAKAAAPYVYTRFKPIEIDPEAAVEFAERIAKVQAKVVVNELDGLGERLARAKARIA